MSERFSGSAAEVIDLGPTVIPMPALRPRRRERPSRAPDLARAERAVRELLLALGEDPAREGLLDTPRRVAKAMAEQVAGLREDPARHLGRVFEAGYDGLVQVRDIGFTSLCEHHLLPFMGQAHIAYIPGDGRVVGLSKLARLVDGFARRPQVQERLTAQVAEALERELRPRGLVVRLEAEHLCMRVRGVRKAGASTVTVLRRGVCAERPDLFPELAGLHAGATGSGH